MNIKHLCWLLSGLSLILIQPTNGYLSKASAFCKNFQCHVERGINPIATANAVYNNSLFQTGWDILNIKAGYGQHPSSNTDIMFAAGFLEGVLTAKRIYNHYKNIYLELQRNSYPKLMKRLNEFFKKQNIWIRKQIVRFPNDPLWRHVNYVITQLDGLMAGYRSIKSIPEITDFGFLLINGMGDILDLRNAFNKTRAMELIKTDLNRYIFLNSHCSALIKVLPGYENIFMSHSSWFWYSSMSRIYKYYDFNIKDPRTFTRQIAFSSYPGLMSSLDDFYLLGGKMVMIQTTNNIFNMSLYHLIKPESLLAWHRVRIANSMARNGKDWSQVLGFKNSGTYNNQYMILDLRKIKLNSDIEDNALWVVEQIPGLVKSADVSEILRTGYWPSYNVPFFEEIYNQSGYNKVYGFKSNQYQMAARAKLFRRDANKVYDLQSMKNLLRSNDYKNDKYSEKNPWNAICSRGDLAEDPQAVGCYDTKVTDFFLAKSMTADIISGPTLGTNLNPFAWSGKFKDSHIGLPEIYDFDFVRTKPFF
ncbi:Phospholipase-B 81,Phospholipase B-like 1,Phospholipase B [Acanthosepion pharaonis]|uniref:Phospholipase B-like n=1 Tax=Acanthosepion pharaonis TaxID=158019 RepID=A0A812BAZ8_ACAPH|nr:Phospholipase-B 81,Phospholipase B-like 1,Phospholipase B [Sepia pharaonis]